MPLSELGNTGLWKRRKLIVLNAVYNLLPPAFTFLLSFLVVRTVSLDLWGEYAKAILFLTFLSQLISWGNKDYLLVAFSKTPAHLYSLWKESILVRSVLLVPCALVILVSSYNIVSKGLFILILVFRFVYQSYDAFILYERKYFWKIVSEISSGMLFVSAVLFLGYGLSFSDLLWITVIADLFKTILLLVLSKGIFPNSEWSFRWSYLRQSFLFFMLTFTGLFISRIDQVITTVMLPLREVGEYQVIMSFLLVIQSSCIFIVQPFLKNIYRFKQQTIRKISLNVGIIGCLLNSLWIFIFYEILTHVYGIRLSFDLIVGSYLFTVPIFYYTVYIYYLLKTDHVLQVIIMNVAGGLSILLFAYTGICFFGKGISIVLWSAVISQFTLALGYLLLSLNSKFKY